MAARLDSVYFSHNMDWVPNSLQMEIGYRDNLSNHLPLTCTFKFNNAKKCKPKGKPKLLMTSVDLFKNDQFRALVSKAIKELERNTKTHGESFASKYKGL